VSNFFSINKTKSALSEMERFSLCLFLVLLVSFVSFLATTTDCTSLNNDDDFQLQLPPLPYAYDALEPIIDQQTMRLHHGGHHLAYTTNANVALKQLKERVGLKVFQELVDQPLAWLLRQIVTEFSIPNELKTALRNNLGGYVNHDLFWVLMCPPGPGRKDRPQGALAAQISSSFQSLENLQAQFNSAALKVFGSGWVWVVYTNSEEKEEEWKLMITTTPNQDHPVIYDPNAKPILALDVWEHAYYLKYQNKRAEYITQWWNVVNWEKVEELFDEAVQQTLRSDSTLRVQWGRNALEVESRRVE